MSLVEKCWMITSNVSVIAVLIITGICFGIFVRPYMKKKKEKRSHCSKYCLHYGNACFIHCSTTDRQFFRISDGHYGSIYCDVCRR